MAVVEPVLSASYPANRIIRKFFSSVSLVPLPCRTRKAAGIELEDPRPITEGGRTLLLLRIRNSKVENKKPKPKPGLSPYVLQVLSEMSGNRDVNAVLQSSVGRSISRQKKPVKEERTQDEAIERILAARVPF